MKRIPGIAIILLVLAAVLAAGCTSAPSPSGRADSLFAQGEQEYRNGNLHAATELFTLAQENYTAAGSPAPALKARNRVITMMMMTVPFPYNRSEAEQAVAASFPGLSAAERAAYLEALNATTILTDGEVMYSADTINNIRFHHAALMQNRTALMHRSPFYDDLMPLVDAAPAAGPGPYGAPLAYEGVTEISIPREYLADTGTLRLWVPLPIETGSQTNVTIVSVEPARYVQSSTGTGADIGIVYLEVPLDTFRDPFLNVTARFRFIQHEQRFTIDPARVLPYNTSNPEYLQYTKSTANIAITPGIAKKAREIVGNETNPYLRAQKIYWYIVDTYPYSHPPHSWLDAMKIPESEYMLQTGIGDCGTQSIYFAALCRSLGIPARAPGGYQMIEGTTGTHFWAEYYIEGYGWVPADVTAAEAADWSYSATTDGRHRYKAYLSRNLDPYRYVIQNDVDLPLVPAVHNPVTLDMAFQIPRAECDTCTTDPLFWLSVSSTTTVTPV